MFRCGIADSAALGNAPQPAADYGAAFATESSKPRQGTRTQPNDRAVSGRDKVNDLAHD
jgi:hypothetical protein